VLEARTRRSRTRSTRTSCASCQWSGRSRRRTQDPQPERTPAAEYTRGTPHFNGADEAQQRGAVPTRRYANCGNKMRPAGRCYVGPRLRIPEAPAGKRGMKRGPSAAWVSNSGTRRACVAINGRKCPPNAGIRDKSCLERSSTAIDWVGRTE